ncbi:MAG: hypothetical protein HKL99_13285 [Burkholderiales bacterium]|nr:hypothetical protein [Burkholderiales bacterium]
MLSVDSPAFLRESFGMLSRNPDKNNNVRIGNIGPTSGTRQNLRQTAPHGLPRIICARIASDRAARLARPPALPGLVVPEHG